LSPAATRYCLPPVRTTANMALLFSFKSALRRSSRTRILPIRAGMWPATGMTRGCQPIWLVGDTGFWRTRGLSVGAKGTAARMKSSGFRDIDMKGRALFISTLWIVIVVALLSALAPLGPPSSKQTGSAFNPATTSVVLKAKSPTPLEAAGATELPKDEPATVPAALFWLRLLAALVLGTDTIHRASFRATHCPSLRGGALLSGRCVRAPPPFS
jgi:hypothetical protein